MDWIIQWLMWCGKNQSAVTLLKHFTCAQPQSIFTALTTRRLDIFQSRQRRILLHLLLYHLTLSSSLSFYFIFFLSSYFHFLLLQCTAVEHPGRRRWCAFCAALNPLQLGSTLRLLNHLGEKPENKSASEHVWCLPAFLAGVQLATGTYRRTVTLVMAFGTKSGKKAIQAAFLWDQDQYDNLGICTVSPCFAGLSLILAAGTRRQSLQSRPWPGTCSWENMKWISNWLDNVESTFPEFYFLLAIS